MTFKNTTHRNSIIRAALEEMHAGESADSTKDIESTDIENVDAVAELQDRVEVLETEKDEMEGEMTEAAGEKVQDDLDAAIDSAVALESLGRVAMAAYRSGTANKHFNAAVAIGIEHICSNLDYPCIVAAVEEDSPDSVGNAAKNLGERALAASKKMVQSVVAFFKKIKDWFVSFFRPQLDGLLRTLEIMKTMMKEVNDVDSSLKIEDADFIKSIGFTEENPFVEFNRYAAFANKAMKYFGTSSLFDTIAGLLDRNASDKTEEIFKKVIDDLSDIFPVKKNTNGEFTLSSGPVVLGGGSIVLNCTTTSETEHKFKTGIVPAANPKAPSSVSVMNPGQFDTIFALLSEIVGNSKKVQDKISKVDGIINLNDVDTVTAENVRLFMMVMNQITTVLVPALLRVNNSTLRKHSAYMRKCIEISKAAKA